MPRSFRQRRKLRERDRKSSTSKSSEFFKHPVIILFIGFLLTTIIGGFFTYYYQKEEVIRQQEYLVKQKYLEYRISSIEDVVDGLGELIASCHNSIKLFQFVPLSKDEEKKILEGWYQSSNNWRSNRYKYAYKIEVYFNNPEIKKTFDEIIIQRIHIGNDISNLLVDYVDNPKEAFKNDDVKKQIPITLEKVNKLEETATKLRMLMIEETRESKSLTISDNFKAP